MDGCESGDTEGLDNQDGPFFFFLQKKIPTILSVMPEEQLCSDEAGWQLRLLEDKRTSLHFPSHKTPPPTPPPVNNQKPHKKYLIHAGNDRCVNRATMKE